MSDQPMARLPLVALRTFIQATRDSGYKSTSAAVAELIDNAFEADATVVSVEIEDDPDQASKRLTITDNGCGMPAQTLRLALQFGGSTRFNSRRGSGRYGMGLPNGSLSQAKRVDVYSWQNPLSIWTMSLDVDEVAEGKMEGLGEPVRFRPAGDAMPSSPSGTMVVLTKCDRLDYRRLSLLVRRLRQDFGRMFRNHLYAGRQLLVNGEPVEPFDPLYLRGANEAEAEAYGPPLHYDIELPSGDRSRILVRFSILPLGTWHSLSNEDKSRFGITKGAGVSIVRSGRELDTGWYFMGSKRKENYDDWWRCEVEFAPEVDELFGVTHTKQRISPTETLINILTPEIERIARELNAHVRKHYLEIREREARPKSLEAAERHEPLLLPIAKTEVSPELRRIGAALSRIQYMISEERVDDVSFYVPLMYRNRLRLVLNRDHKFFGKIYEPLSTESPMPPALMLQHLQLLLLSAARAECGLKTQSDRDAAKALRRGWSNALTAFLG